MDTTESIKKIFPQTNLEEIRQEQINLPNEATSFLLGVYLRQIRRMMGVKNVWDEVEQTAELINEINYIINHNPIFYLMLIQRFDLLKEIFKDKNFYRELALIEEIEKQTIKQQATILTLNEIILKQTKNAIQKANNRATPPFNGMELYKYYDLLIKKERENYSIKTAIIYKNAANKKMDIFNRIIEVINANPAISLEKTTFLEEAKTEQIWLLQIKHELDQAESNFNRDPHDTLLIEHYLNLSKNYYDGTNRLDRLLEKIQSWNPLVEELYNESIQITQEAKIDLHRVETTSKEKINTLLEHQEKVDLIIKTSIDNSLGCINNILNKCSTDRLKPVEQEKIQQFIAKSKRPNHFSKEDTHAQMEIKLTNYLKEFKEIEPILEKALTPHLVNEVKAERNHLETRVLSSKEIDESKEFLAPSELVGPNNLLTDEERALINANPSSELNEKPVEYSDKYKHALSEIKNEEPSQENIELSKLMNRLLKNLKLVEREDTIDKPKKDLIQQAIVLTKKSINNKSTMEDLNNLKDLISKLSTNNNMLNEHYNQLNQYTNSYSIQAVKIN